MPSASETVWVADRGEAIEIGDQQGRFWPSGTLEYRRDTEEPSDRGAIWCRQVGSIAATL
jgi:hypothetical protein